MNRERQQRLQVRETAKSHGLPNTIRRRRKAICVVLDQIWVPDWAARLAIKGLSISKEHVWLKRSDALVLIAYDRDAGGQPQITECEYRICPRCKHASIAEDAEVRRALDQRFAGESLPCGSYCVDRSNAKRRSTQCQ